MAFYRAFPLLFPRKVSTGLVGLDVIPTEKARNILINLYTKTLDELNHGFPKNTPYRVAVEAFTTHRLKVVKEETDPLKIEQRINAGQLEELIEQARDELDVLAKMREWKPWEETPNQRVEVEIIFDSSELTPQKQ
jgi:NADH dehydrogenase (ubiquinone) 1 alpha subcomplex subunit 5